MTIDDLIDSLFPYSALRPQEPPPGEITRRALANEFPGPSPAPVATDRTRDQFSPDILAAAHKASGKPMPPVSTMVGMPGTQSGPSIGGMRNLAVGEASSPGVPYGAPEDSQRVADGQTPAPGSMTTGSIPSRAAPNLGLPDTSPTFGELAGGFFAGLSGPAASQAYEARNERRRSRDMSRFAANKTYNALIAKKVDPDLAAAATLNPDILKAVLPVAFGTGKEYGKTGSVFLNPETGGYEAVQYAADGTIKRTPLGSMTPDRGVAEIDRGPDVEIIDKATGLPRRVVQKDLRGAERDKGLGDLDAKKAAAMPKVRSALSAAEEKWTRLESTIDTAIEQAGPLTTGLAAASARVYGSPAHNLQKTLATIQANIGFDALNEMRQNSPTGGALGQVSERELEYLQATIASLAQTQDDGQLKKNLAIVKDALRGSLTRLKAAYEQDFGSVAGFSQQGAGGGSFRVLGVR